MKKETILKLLKSSNYDDVILGLNYMKDYTWDKILTMGRYSDRFQSVTISTEAGGRTSYDNYILNNNLCCHFNASLFFYEKVHSHVNYKQL